jgi:NTE family protein
MNTTLSSPLHATTSERALVLGGGGSTGNAWLIGVIAGLYEAGLDVTDADVIIGTSAGSTAAAQITGASPAGLFADTVSAVPPQRTGPAGSGRPPGSPADQMNRMQAIFAASVDPADMRRRLGAAAIERAAAADGSRRSQWRTTVASRLPSPDWPERTVLITAVDARTGDAVVFDRHSGVELVDAVAASCSSGVAYAIGDDEYIDGGFRVNAENADLAAGCARVLVLSPFGGRTLTPPEWNLQLSAQIDELRSHGSTVETISPDVDAEHMFGVNAMNLSLRPAAARAGYDQGRALAGRLTEFWR